MTEELDLTLTADYDPRACGAMCDRCPLGKTGKPVPPELRKGSFLTIVAESAGGTEVMLERPLVGASGRELMRALREGGIRREDCSLTNAMLCQPPGGNLKAYQAQVRKRNKDRVKRGLEPYLMPTDACWPRLLRELHQADALLLMGAYSRAAVYKAAVIEDPDDSGGGEKKLMKSRGFPSDVILPAVGGMPPKKVKTLATIHAAFVLRKRRWTTIFRGDVAKSVRMATDSLGYKEPALNFDPKPEWLANFLYKAKGPFAYDVETDMHGDSIAQRNLRCIGIGTSETVTCVPWKSVERPSRIPYTHSEREQITNIMTEWFGDPKGLVCDHNGQFDKTVMESNIPGLRVLRRRFDTVIAHHIVWSELKHDLGFLSAQMTDAPQHKDVDHDKWTSDYDLHKYCMLDVATTAWCANILAADERLRGQKKALATDMFLSEFCRKMHEVGVMVDIFARDVWYKRLGEEAAQHMKKAREFAAAAVGKKATHARLKFAQNINPNSPHQIRQLLFNDLGLDPVPEKAGGYTDSGDPAVGKDQIFYLIDQGLPREVEDFLLAVVDYREASKLRGTYCEVEPGRHGRIHPTWNPHVVLSGRLSCSDPNLMNVRKPLRSIYRSANGHVFVIWDKAQLEARITAWLAQDERQIAAFRAGADIHRVNACDVLGIASPDLVSKDERQFCKTFVYAVQYLASLRKAWQMVRNFVNPKTGQRDYRDLTFGQAEASFNRFWKARGSIQAYHEGNREKWEQFGYIEDVIDGRRRYFLDGGGDESVKEEQANFPIQSCNRHNTKILSRDGIVAIGDAPEEGTVWTGSRWAPYKKVYSAPCEIAELELANGQVLECDTNHQVLVVGENDYEFRHWRDLEPGDHVCLSVAEPLEFGDPGALDNSTAYWMGFAIGNGSTAEGSVYRCEHRHRLTMTFGDRKNRYQKEEKAEEFKTWARAQGLQPQKDQVRDGSISVTVEASWFHDEWEGMGYPWGETAHSKRIPRVVWSSCLSARKSFLLGLLDSDGCVQPSREKGKTAPNLHMCQRELLDEVQTLARSVGVRSNLRGPYQEGRSWRLDFSETHLAALGYGSASRKPKSRDLAPRFVVERFLRLVGDRKAPHHTSEATLLYRLRHGGSVSVETLPYLARSLGMPCPQLYATSELVEKRAMGFEEPTFTLSVDDPGHRYDSEGIISKNTAAADVNRVTRRLVEAYPWGFDGPNTGIIHQCHDSLMIECKEEHAIEIAKRGQQILYSQLGDMPLPVDIGIGYNYRDLTEYVQCPRCGGSGCGACSGNGILPEKQAKGLQV